MFLLCLFCRLSGWGFLLSPLVITHFSFRTFHFSILSTRFTLPLPPPTPRSNSHSQNDSFPTAPRTIPSTLKAISYGTTTNTSFTGCLSGMEQHLPTLMPLLVTQLSDPKPLVRSISCWTLGRYAAWTIYAQNESHANAFFRPLVEGVCVFFLLLSFLGLSLTLPTLLTNFNPYITTVAPNENSG